MRCKFLTAAQMWKLYHSGTECEVIVTDGKFELMIRGYVRYLYARDAKEIGIMPKSNTNQWHYITCPAQYQTVLNAFKIFGTVDKIKLLPSEAPHAQTDSI